MKQKMIFSSLLSFLLKNPSYGLRKQQRKDSVLPARSCVSLSQMCYACFRVSLLPREAISQCRVGFVMFSSCELCSFLSKRAEES